MNKFILSLGVAALLALPAVPTLASTTHHRAQSLATSTHAHTALVAKKHKKHKKHHKKATATAAFRHRHAAS